MELIKLNKDSGEHSVFTSERITDFLLEELDKFGNYKSSIRECLEYIFKEGGFIMLAADGEEIVGAIVISRNEMGGYLPKNTLIYLAVKKGYRGHGVGKELILSAMGELEGSVSLFVEPDNPARFLYEKMGFTCKYIEMRLIRD